MVTKALLRVASDGRFAPIRRRGWLWALLVFAIPYYISPVSANHCSSSVNCPKLYPGPHPAADRGFMWACDWPDGFHWRCHTVRRPECTCNYRSGDFRDADNFRQAQNLVAAFQKCVDQNGTATLIKNTGNTPLFEWAGIECEFSSGQKWYESHPTTDICFDLANKPGEIKTEHLPTQLETSEDWCRAN